MKPSFRVCVGICTYKRVSLLVKLIEDLFAQSHKPDRLILVDGDPSSGEVKKAISNHPMNNRIRYVASNHPNVAYQRYLVWRAAAEEPCDALVYFDDDLRLPDKDTLFQIAGFLCGDTGVVGVTVPSATGPDDIFRGHEVVLETQRRKSQTSWIVRAAGSARKIPPGGLAPSGHRRMPEGKKAEEEVEWLQGRVMGFRMSALDETCFPEALFAANDSGCGFGEDTVISHLVSFKGKLLFLNRLQVAHPDDDLPRAYPIQPFRYGRAVAYSRRVINDYFRGLEKPLCSDRFDLVKSYAGNFLLSLFRLIREPKSYRFLYLAGYSWGALKGCLISPSPRNLTPDIDWKKDAEKALLIHKDPEG